MELRNSEMTLFMPNPFVVVRFTDYISSRALNYGLQPPVYAKRVYNIQIAIYRSFSARNAFRIAPSRPETAKTDSVFDITAINIHMLISGARWSLAHDR